MNSPSPDLTDRQEKTIAALAAATVVPVLRADNIGSAIALVNRLVRAGAKAVELTTTIPGWTEVLAAATELRDRTSDRVLIGMGTVLNATDADRALELDADFLVSPFPAPTVRGPADDADVLFVEGGSTPAEVAAAAKRGMAKLFPAHLGGPAYLTTLLSVLPGARIIPTGGINVGDVGSWLRAGALAVGVGRDLYNAEDITVALAQATRSGTR
ncbi:bifunctional 4-hydroxy-2-oxoglutarate aldolase/2-dehydro-3-deoxy-phosphogluconate aldolase [Amycolatopsis taiwanensis]|uniref:2-keto-3-deoxy-phosphogluconate aldolase n=1 Tax=Amycolatopsis taiwanensis TaxID=342230 RepID=A0A9W6VMI4_9PSEU|nr:bifunctional 4-hydroxy-2-oxoglutarate aldolase/2-dehydro-3-deoxy-phosphogluconate aldolase [Amycolatopsis taiwanensis]GLY71571.1 2-keto-3-deoxy-phosphogluconate aldolase [Amycolatopsis taiwanensis]